MLDAITVQLGSDTFQVRPLFPALRAISQKFGGLMAAGERAQALDVDAMAQILTDVLAANGHPMKVEVVGERMMEKPLIDWVGTILEIVAAAIQPGPEVPVDTGDAKSADDS